MEASGMHSIKESAPHPRLAGAFYLLTFLTGAAAVPASRLIVPGNAAATIAGILAHPALFQSSFVAYLLNVAVYIVVTLLFYELFKPVSRSLSLLAAFFSLSGCSIQAVACVFYRAPLLLLKSPAYLGDLTPPQLQAIAVTALRLHAQAYNIGLIFFGFYCLLLGILILRSTFLPRVLGVLMALSGLAWLTFLWPPLLDALSPYNRAVGALGEAALTLWLLFRSVNLQRWIEQADRPIRRP